MDKIYFVMPAYNEEENIEEVVRMWHPVVEGIGGESRLVIANDGSRDNTYAKMLELQKAYPLLVPLDKPNSGHGATVLFLYRYALENGADYVFQTDSDGQTLPQEFVSFYENREEYDFVIGSRRGRQDGKSRVVVTRVLRLVVWMMFHVWVKDANTPFRLMKTERLKNIMEVVPPDFFLSNVAISAIAVRWKYRIKWIPVTFRPRQGGVNSINLKRIFKIGWKALGDFRKIVKGLK